MKPNMTIYSMHQDGFTKDDASAVYVEPMTSKRKVSLTVSDESKLKTRTASISLSLREARILAKFLKETANKIKKKKCPTH